MDTGVKALSLGFDSSDINPMDDTLEVCSAGLSGEAGEGDDFELRSSNLTLDMMMTALLKFQIN